MTNAVTGAGGAAVNYAKNSAVGKAVAGIAAKHGTAAAIGAGLGGAALAGLATYGLYKGAKELFGKKVPPSKTTYPPPPTDEYYYKPGVRTSPPNRWQEYPKQYPYYPYRGFVQPESNPYNTTDMGSDRDYTRLGKYAK